MKTLKTLFLAVTLLLFLWGNGYSALIEEGNVIYDDVAQQYWIKDLTLFTGQTYSQQQSTIASLNANPGYESNKWDEWHMASRDEVGVLYRDYPYQIPAMFTQTDSNASYFGDSVHWWGRYDENVDLTGTVYNKVFHLSFAPDVPPSPESIRGGGLENYILPDDTLAYGVNTGAWVTASAVPLPGPVWLLGSGMVGLVGLRKKLKR